MAVTSKQLNLVKQHIHVTFEDKNTNERVITMIEDAIPDLQHKLGLAPSFDFFQPGQERRLFLEFCAYIWNGCKEDFSSAYLDEINQIRRKYGVEIEKTENSAI